METQITKSNPKQREKKKALILFTSHPTKEAFRKHIGQNVEQYQEIYQGFLRHTLDIVTTVQQDVNFDVIVASDKTDEHNIASAYAAFPEAPVCKFIEHSANSFDQKLKDALNSVYTAGYEQVAIIGNDCLDLTPEILCSTFD